ncbi:MAG TPA: adventurous gliding motility TPR repeat lipoprotein GltE [Anaeromyxobacteraceae bacterium]|nr:adventurous gliding motility TPR repeat lipoprotein GltE [Anaeromyxobacteraceae bacterium]
MNCAKRCLVALPLLALAGCAGGGAARQETASQPSPSPASPDGERPRALSPRGQRLFEEAVAAAEEQKQLKVPPNWEALERRWRRVLEVEQLPEAWFNVGVALEHRGRPGEAREAYRRALALEPRFGPAATNLALLDEPKDPVQAAQAWAELSRRFPDDSLPRERLAALYLASGQRDEAWKLAREALVRDHRAIGAYKVMMRVALERGKLDLANLLAVKALKLDQDDPEVVAFVGDVLRQQKDEPAAVAHWKKAISLEDDFLPARYKLLADAFAKEHWEGAAEQARAILRTKPDDARVELALGIAYRYLGQADKALSAYEQAERLSGGKLAEVHLAKAVTLMKSKEQCEPALNELRLYVAAAGPSASADGPAPRLERECEQILAANKQAEEAARQLKVEAEREAARKAAAAAPTPPQDSAGKKPGVDPRLASPADDNLPIGNERPTPTK